MVRHGGEWTVVGTSLDLSWRESCRKLCSYLGVHACDPVQHVLQEMRVVDRPITYPSEVPHSPFVDIEVLPHFRDLNDKLFLKKQLKLLTYDYKVPMTDSLRKEEIYNFCNFAYPQVFKNIVNVERILR